MVSGETVGERVRMLRRRRVPRLSQEALGAAVGKSRSWIVRVEDGSADPQVADVVALARFFGVSDRYLLAGEEDRGQPERQSGRAETTEDLTGMVRRAVRDELRA